MSPREAPFARDEAGPARKILTRGLSVLVVGLVDFGAPFVRMLILSRLLNLDELGFSSALAATYGSFEQITDIAIHRFVFSSPRADYAEALASAHALSVIRGCAVGSLALLASPALALLFSTDGDWMSFAVLAIVVFGRSLEHLEPRVLERDYRYGAQFNVSLAANGFGLAALAAAAVLSRSHVALLAALFAHMLGAVAASHWVSSQPYRLRFGSPYFRRGWSFGYPLMFNGLGLAVTSQGDRLMVGALLGLPALGLYSVALLASVVPISLVLKVMTTLNLAALRNSSTSAARFSARLRLYARATPLIAAGYALGLLAFMNLGISIAFGARFVVDNRLLAALALGAFFKIVRTEPFTSLLLQQMKTGRLALTSLSTFSGLGVGAGLTMKFATLLAPLAGRLAGEIVGLCSALYLSRRALQEARGDFVASLALALLVVGAAILALLATGRDSASVLAFAVLGSSGIAICAAAALFLPRLLRAGYGRAGERGRPSATAHCPGETVADRDLPRAPVGPLIEAPEGG